MRPSAMIPGGTRRNEEFGLPPRRRHRPASDGANSPPAAVCESDGSWNRTSLGFSVVDREGDQSGAPHSGRPPPGGRASQRGIEPFDVGQDLEIAVAQHRAAIRGSGRDAIARRIGVAVDGERGQRKAKAGECRARFVHIRDEPADMVEENLTRRGRLAGFGRDHGTGALSRPRPRPNCPGSPPSSTRSTGSRRSWCAPCR